MRKTGTHEILGTTKFFIPKSLPPQEPLLNLDYTSTALYGDAMRYLGKLNEISQRVPNTERFIKSYVTIEALLSSAIEGVHTTLLDMFTQPLLETKPDKNTQLALNYTTALYKAISMIKDENYPIIADVMLTAHKVLMESGEGDKSSPGRFRKQSVKVGNLVPPPHQKIKFLISELEKFINENKSLPPLIKAGLVHYQFETIHPFLDGNGRIGRMLIVLMMIESGLLSAPILYPSYYFKKYSNDYYNSLRNVQTKGDFESWIIFYLSVIKNSSIDAYKRALDIESLEKKTIKIIDTNKKLSTPVKKTMKKALSIFFNYPVISIKSLASKLNASYNTAHKIIMHCIDMNLLIEQTKQKREKLFRFSPYISVLEKEYDLKE